MKRLWLVGLIPPLVVAAVALLIVPTSFYSPGATIALVFLAGLYFAFVSLPILAPRSEKSLIFSASYALVVWPYLVAAAGVALLALFIHAISWKWILAGDIIILGLVVGAALITTSLSERDAKLNSKTKRAVSDLRRLALQVENAANSVADPAIRKHIKQVAEQIRLSPFKGVAGSAAIESEIEYAVSELSVAADSDRLTPALDNISQLVEQRNRIVKIER